MNAPAHPRLLALLLLLALLALAQAFGGCATSTDVPAALTQPVDSAVQAQAVQARLAALLKAGKVKFYGPVTLQLGGTGNSANTTAASRAKAPVASAPGAVATSTATGASWKLYALLVGLALLLGAVGGFCLARQWPRLLG